MNPLPHISDAEWKVLAALWKESPLSSAQLLTKLAFWSWKPSTVRTFLVRLEKKGAVIANDAGGLRTYVPKVSREECVLRESELFLERVFEGGSAALLIHFAKTKRLGKKELAEVHAVLAKNKKRKK